MVTPSEARNPQPGTRDQNYDSHHNSYVCSVCYAIYHALANQLRSLEHHLNAPYHSLTNLTLANRGPTLSPIKQLIGRHTNVDVIAFVVGALS